MNRFMFWGVLFLLVIPVSIGISRWMRQPHLYPGDTLEYRTCRECGGRGVEAGDPSEGPQEGPGAPGSPCVACGGKNKVPVIIPGPNHPRKVNGVVFDDSTEGDLEVMLAERDPRANVPGAVVGAQVVLEKGSERLEFTSNQKGRFRGVLSPGEWKYTANASGFQPSTGTFVVLVRSEPIWQEEAHIVRPDEEHEGEPLGIPMKK